MPKFNESHLQRGYTSYRCPICGKECKDEEAAENHCSDKIAKDDECGFYIPK